MLPILWALFILYGPNHGAIGVKASSHFAIRAPFVSTHDVVDDVLGFDIKCTTCANDSEACVCMHFRNCVSYLKAWIYSYNCSYTY